MISPAVEKVSPEVIVDLWPAYCAGTASPQTRALVEGCLARDPDLAQRLRAEDELQLEPLPRRGWPAYRWLLLLAMLFSCFAFGRIVSDTSWDTSPAGFIVAAVLAVGLWAAFLVSLARVSSLRAQR
jgi:hypothetical protein